MIRIHVPFVRCSTLHVSSLVLALIASTSAAHAQPAAETTATGSSAAVQEPSDPNPGAVSVSGGFDVQSTYMFRGIRQHSTGVATWPWADLGIAAYSGDGAVKSLNLNVGSWNSQHTGDTGADGPSQKIWYESDFYATLGMGLGGGVGLSTTYTAYTSPNNTFTSVKEISVKLALDDSTLLGKAAFKPYALLAREFGASPGAGQADGGTEAGTYLELGISPGIVFSKASVAVPVKMGLSLANYYEVGGVDERFGFVSAAAVVTVPLGAATRYGSWNIHGGVEFQKLGAHAAFFNGDKKTRTMGTVGVGFAY